MKATCAPQCIGMTTAATAAAEGLALLDPGHNAVYFITQNGYVGGGHAL